MGSGDLLPDLRGGKALTLAVDWSRACSSIPGCSGPRWRWSCIIFGCCSLWNSNTGSVSFFYLSGMFKFHQRTKNNPKGFQPHVEGSCVLLMNGCSAEGMARGDEPGPNANAWMGSSSSWPKLSGSSWLSIAKGCEVSGCSDAGATAGSACGKS